MYIEYLGFTIDSHLKIAIITEEKINISKA